MAIQILKDSAGNNLVVKAVTSEKITATMHDYAGVAIVKASLLTLTMTLKDGSGNVVNSRSAVNIKDANGGYVATDGTLSLYLSAADNTPLESSKDTEKRILLLTFTWNDGVDSNNQTGAGEYTYTVDSTSDAK